VAPFQSLLVRRSASALRRSSSVALALQDFAFSVLPQLAQEALALRGVQQV
jgi:hypothetical protein